MSSHPSEQDSRNEIRIGLAALITGVFMFAEVAGGIYSGSLALLADAGHMLTDFASLTVAWFALRAAKRPSARTHAYRFDRLQILAAFANGLALIVITGWIIWEAFNLFAAPHEVKGDVMLGVGIAGLLVNVVAMVLLRGIDRANLNVSGASVHVLGDLLGSVAVLVAATVIVMAGWTGIDPLMALVIAAILARSALTSVLTSGRILLGSVPVDIEADAIIADVMGAVAGLRHVHKVHVWPITHQKRIVTLHAHVDGTVDPLTVLYNIRQRLLHRFKIEEATIEIEFDPPAYANPPAGGAM